MLGNPHLGVASVSGVECSHSGCIALKSDGTVVGWGKMSASTAYADSFRMDHLWRGGTINYQNGGSETILAVMLTGSVEGDTSRASATVEIIASYSNNQGGNLFAARKANGDMFVFGSLTLDAAGVTVGAAEFWHQARNLDGSDRIVSMYSNDNAIIGVRTDGAIECFSSDDTCSNNCAAVWSYWPFRYDVADNYVGENALGTLHEGWGGGQRQHRRMRFSQYNGADRAPISKVIPSKAAFAFLHSDGTVSGIGKAVQSSGNSDPGCPPATLNQPASLTSLKVTQIVGSDEAFAALREDGSVETYGLCIANSNNPSLGYGGGSNSDCLAPELKSGGSKTTVARLYRAKTMMVAVHSDTSVTAWGYRGLALSSKIATPASSDFIGVDLGVTPEPRSHKDYTKCHGTSCGLPGRATVACHDWACAAIMRDGQVITWGSAASGGTTYSSGSSTTGWRELSTTKMGAFAALNNDGTVMTWGDAAYGGSTVTIPNSDPVSSIYSNEYAFVFLHRSGGVPDDQCPNGCFVKAHGAATKGGDLQYQGSSNWPQVDLSSRLTSIGNTPVVKKMMGNGRYQMIALAITPPSWIPPSPPPTSGR